MVTIYLLLPYHLAWGSRFYSDGQDIIYEGAKSFVSMALNSLHPGHKNYDKVLKDLQAMKQELDKIDTPEEFAHNSSYLWQLYLGSLVDVDFDGDFIKEIERMSAETYEQDPSFRNFADGVYSMYQLLSIAGDIASGNTFKLFAETLLNHFFPDVWITQSDILKDVIDSMVSWIEFVKSQKDALGYAQYLLQKQKHLDFADYIY